VEGEITQDDRRFAEIKQAVQRTGLGQEDFTKLTYDRIQVLDDIEMSQIEVDGQRRDFVERDAIDEWTIVHSTDIVRSAGWKTLAFGISLQLLAILPPLSPF
jgi:hypothetical protein